MARKLGNWLRTYAKFTDITEAPDMFHFWTGVSTIAGALRRNVWFDQVTFKWFPNFYVLFVAPPGIATKSSTMGIGMSLLRQVEGVFMGPASMTWQGLTTALQNSTTMVPFGDLSNPLETQFVAQSSITCEVSELGTFLDPRNDELISVLIDLWDGKEGYWERWLKVADNTKIENPWINIIAATTPSWLKMNFNEQLIGGGLASRMIFAYADQKKRLIPFVDEVTNLDEHFQMEKDLVHDLRDIAEMRGAFTLSPEARKHERDRYNRHWTKRDEHLLDRRYEGYLARKQTHIMKLAMILSASESSNMMITLEHIALAENFITGIEYDMHKAFDTIRTSDEAKHTYELLNQIKTFPCVSQRDLWRVCMRAMGPKEFGDATKALIDAGFLQIKQEDGDYMYYYLGGDEKERKDMQS